jgi:DNA-directed RNA polymerase subunit RPC12/RpoP
MTEETTIRFPDGIKLDADVSADDLANITERVCVNCGGQEQMRGGFGASEYTVVRCPTCGLLYPGDPVQ